MATRLTLLALITLAAASRSADPPPAAKPDLSKSTAPALTEALLTDRTGGVAQRLKGQSVELTGVVRANVRADGGRTVTLFGWDVAAHKGRVRAVLQFPPKSPDLPRVQTLGLGDEVTVRATFEGATPGNPLEFKFVQVALLAGGGVTPPDYDKPSRTVEAAEFIRDGLASPDALSKIKGQVVTLTGVVAKADPATTPAGLRLAARPESRTQPPFAECQVVDDLLDAVWELPVGTRVRVIGVVGHRDATETYVDPNMVVLGKCRVALFEPNPILRVSAADLAAAYKADWKAAGEKYGSRETQKAMIVTGEVAAVSSGRYGTSVTLKQSVEGAEVLLSFPPGAADGSAVKVGQSVRAKAMGSGTPAPAILRIQMSGNLVPEPKTSLPVVK